MKPNFVLIILLSALCLSTNAQTIFQKTFGTTGRETSTVICQTSDSGYILLSPTYDSTSIFTYIVKTDSVGNKMWSEKINCRVEAVRSIVQTQDSGYIFYGDRDFSSSNTNPCLIKLNSNGDIVWQKFYNWSSQPYYYIRGIREDIGGTGYIILGENWQYLMLIKVDLSGDFVWGYQMNPNETPGTDATAGDFVQLNSDSCFYLLGASRYGSGDEEIILSKFSKTGNNMWTKSLSITGGLNSWPHSKLSIKETYDSNLMIGFIEGGSFRLTIVEVDTSGTPVSNAMRYSLPSYGTNWVDWDLAKPTIDNSLYLAATVVAGENQNVIGLTDILLSKTDTSANIVSAYQIGGKNQDYIDNIITTNDGGVIIGGTTKSFSAGYDDLFLIKTDSSLTFSCNSDSSVSPNVEFPIATFSDFYCPAYNAYLNPEPSNYTAITITDTTYDACGCVPPKAVFSTGYPEESGGIQDYSTWATNWLWDYGNGQTDTSAIPIPDYISNGIYTVCLKVSNACGEDSICHRINYVQITISTPENNSIAIEIFPNPVHDIITLQTTSADKTEYTVCDIQGRQLQSGSFIQNKTIDVRNFANGIYFLQLQNEKEVWSRKFVKQ